MNLPNHAWGDYFSVSCTIVGILIESIAKMKLLCCKEIFFEETNWEIGYLALDLFPFLNAIGKSFRSTSRLSKIWVGERGNIVFNTYLRLDQLKLLGQFGISISLLHQFWEATTWRHYKSSLRFKSIEVYIDTRVWQPSSCGLKLPHVILDEFGEV